MHGLRTIERLNRENAEAEKIVQRHREDPTAALEAEERFKADVEQARERTAQATR